MTQAVLNVMGKERYATVPDEVRKYVLGYYGEIAGPIEPNIYRPHHQRRRAGQARRATCWSRAYRPPRRGPFTSDDDLLSAFYPGANTTH